jgi:homocysteine S-methyltransferase
LTKQRNVCRTNFRAFGGGVDLFVLETFSDLSEIEQAIKAVKELCDLPIVAQMTSARGQNHFRRGRGNFYTKIRRARRDVIGLNCGVGPTHILTALEKMRA